MGWNHPDAGGVEVNLRETLTRLSERGHNVHFLTSYFPGAEREEQVEGVKIYRTGLRTRSNEMYALTLGQIRLSLLERRIDPDVVYTVNSIAGWALPFSSTPHVTAFHHLYGKAIFRQMKFPLNLIGWIAERTGLMLASNREVVSVSPSTTADLMDEGIDKDRITEIENAVDTEKYCRDAGKDEEQLSMLYLGRFEYNKGIDLLPKIYRKVSEKVGVRLDIAGFGSMDEVPKEMASEFEDVVFHGYVDEDTKKELLSKASVLVTPSRIEGWGMNVSEANASSTPAVGADTGGLKDSIIDGETGFLADKDDLVANMSEKTVRLLEDDELREELGENAREFAESRDWGENVDRLERLFDRVTDGRH